MRNKEQRKDVDKLIKEIRKLNENSKGLIVDLNDYNEIKEELEELQLTLLSNIKPYIKEMYNKLEEIQLTLLRNIKPYIKEISKKDITFLNKTYICDFNKTAVKGCMHYIIVDNKIYRSYTQMLMDDDLILGSEIIKIRELTPLEMMLGVVETDLGTIEF